MTEATFSLPKHWGCGRRPGLPWGGGVSPGLSCPTFPSHSSSVRIPASSFTLGQKLERYHTAVQVGGAGRLPCVVGVVGAHPQGSTACALCSQRSESVRSLGPSRAEFLVAPVDVASKRHLFEKELVGQGREGAASGRKVSGSGR